SASLWSHAGELVPDRAPQRRTVGELLPEGTVIDGEILPWKAGAVLPFAQLQKRIGRKTLSKKLLEEVPVILMAYDLLETGGEDVRDKPLSWRREQLTKLVNALNGSAQPAGLSPSPLRGEGRGGAYKTPSRQPASTPHPNPPPQGGREQDTAPAEGGMGGVLQLSPLVWADSWE